jgi:tetratricopeptide (TPR) repeat protein
VADIAGQLGNALRDRYVIERELGRGGMATVYLARDLKHDRLVALKVLHPDLAATLGPDRFQREIRLAARLQHPHIVTVHDSGEAAGQLWFTMPYVEGESLRDRLRHEVQLPVDHAVRIAREVGLALDYAHRHGVVHRDIKPENILLSDGQALLADFGISQALETAGATRLTETGLTVGTPAYMSPEQASGGPVDGRSDQYGLGCVLYEMLAGEPPYTGPTAQAIVAKRLSEPVPRLGALRQVPPNVEAAVTKALARVPADRFSSAHEFADALAADASTSVPDERPGSYPVRAAAPRASRRLVFSLLSASVIGLVTLLVAKAHRAVPVGVLPASLAVLPFQVTGPGLSLWREGLVSLFSANLDGAARLRTLSDRTVLSRWKRSFADAGPELSQAIRLARDLGADRALTGSLVGTTSGVRLVAEVYGTADGSLHNRAQVEGATDSVPALVDRLSVQLLQSGALGSAEGLSPKGVGQLFTQSLPALKAYLTGEQKFRSFQPQQAIPDFQQAAALDSTFAIALARLALVIGWSNSPHMLLRTPLEPLELAHRHSSRLPPRERSVVEGMWQLGHSWTEAIGTFRKLTVERPDDAEAWFLLGDALFHLGGAALESGEKFREALGRSIALDPGFGPAYLHLVEDAFDRGDSAAVRRYVEALWDIDSTAPRAIGLRIARDVVWGNVSVRQSALQRMDTAADAAVMAAKHAINPTVDLSEPALAIIDRIVRGQRHSDDTKASAYAGGAVVYEHLGQLDRARESYRRGGPLVHASQEEDEADLADFDITWYLFGGGDSTIAAKAMTRLNQLPDSLFLSYSPEVAWLALRWRDRSVLSRVYHVTEEEIRKAAVAGDTDRVRLRRVELRLLRALEANDKRIVLKVFPQGIRDYPAPFSLAGTPSYFARLELAQRLYTKGDYAGAERLLRSFSNAEYYPSPAAIALWLGKVYEGMGDRRRAAEEYDKVAAWWKNADPVLQPKRQEALDGLRRTAGESAEPPHP